MSEKLLNIQDQYKFPMGQLIHDREPDAEVTFRMHNRKKDMHIVDYVQPQELQEYYDELRALTYSPEDIAYLETQPGKNYSREYLGYLATFRLPEIEVFADPEHGDLAARTTAKWNAASQWEIPMLSAIPELYYPRLIAAQDRTMSEVWNEGDRRLTQFIDAMKTNDIKWAEFGTRRRFSSDWQDHAVERFVTECPDQFVGTSNAHLARKYNVPAIGTNAHELSMVYAALAEQRGGNPLDGQAGVITDWLDRFPSMPVALIDTFTSDVTLHDMTPHMYDNVRSYRIDSGVEKEIGEKVIRQLMHLGIDPRERTLMFTNSLKRDKIVELQREFEGKIGVSFGVGGGSVNDMGLPDLNIVSKAVEVNGYDTVKLSDDAGKHMGEPADVARYQRLVETRLAGTPKTNYYPPAA